MTKKYIAEKWVNSMMDKGFMQGWLGDKSKNFRNYQIRILKKVMKGDVKCIGGNHRLLSMIASDYSNLEGYCGWTKKELEFLLKIFGFSNIREVYAVMHSGDLNKYMENGKLKKEVTFRLIPVI